MIQSHYHSCSLASAAGAQKISPITYFFNFVYKRYIQIRLPFRSFPLKCWLLLLFNHFITQQPSSSLIWWAVPHLCINCACVDFHVQHTQQCFIVFAVKLQYGRSGYNLAHISKLTEGQRQQICRISSSQVVQLVMVA